MFNILMPSSKELEKMCEIIETFSKEEHIKILKIINDSHNHNSISENNNGTFIHMEDLNDSTIEQIQKYIDYVLLKEGTIKEVEDTKDKLKNDINAYTNE
jgi:hypothetical protein